MPYKFNWESGRTIHVLFHGTVTQSDLTNASNDLFNDPRSDSVRQAYWDFTGIEGFTFEWPHVREIAATDSVASTYMGRMKAAFIIQDIELAELARGYIREMENMGSPWKNRLFPSMEEARQWMAA